MVGFTRLVEILFEYAVSRCAIQDAKIEDGVVALQELHNIIF